MFRCAPLLLLASACGATASATAPAAPPPVPTNVAAPDPDDDSPCRDFSITGAPDPAPGMVVSANELVGRKMTAHAPAMRACWLGYWRDHHDSTGGRMSIDFHVHPDRAADGFETHGFSPELDRCICRVVAAIDFERLGEASVHYPLYFAQP